MSAFVIDYSELSKVSSYANSLAKKADEYADSLTKKIANKVDNITGGANNTVSSAKYYVNAKVEELREKKTVFENFAKGISNLVTNAKKIDKEVAKAISCNKNKFLKSNQHLKIDDWKANIINWLVDVKNSCPIFELIGNGFNYIGTKISSALDNIKYWYKCEGGKEVLAFVAAIGGAIIAIGLFIASLPASGVFAVFAAIGAAITGINALTNVATSFVSMISAKTGDPAWAKIYGDEDKLSDWLRNTKFKNGISNRISYGAATTISSLELVCDVVNIINLVKKTKLDFLKNYFDKNTGLLSYMKSNVSRGNGHGVLETKYTTKSIWNGLKAYVMNKPIDTHSELGIRTLLHQNFKTDIKMFFKSTFSVTAWKETFRYNVTDGGRVSFSEWKQAFSISTFRDTLKYNLSNSSLKGMFTEGVKWEHKQDYIKTTANGLKSIIDLSQKLGAVVIGEYSISDDIQKNLRDNKTGFTNCITIKDQIDKLVTKSQSTYKNSYYYKNAHATN